MMTETITNPASQRQICAFILNGHCFGIDVQYVQEVFRFQKSTPVPMTPPLVTGLLNLRGQIVMAIDLRMRLGMPERTTDQLPTNVVVRTGDGVLSFLVDDLFDIMTLPNDNLEAIPETLTGIEREFVTGCYKLQNRLLLMLDTILVADISDILRDAINAPDSS
jgi:purine-binding chemotaxis protein CheW